MKIITLKVYPMPMVGLRSVIKIVESETIETRVFLINKMLLQLDRSLPLRNLKK